MLFQSLLLSVWFQREKEILQSPETTTASLHTLLLTLSSMEGVCVHPRCSHQHLHRSSRFCPSGAVEDSWDPQSVSPWWQQVRSACVQSQNAAAALLAAFVAHHAAKACIKPRAGSKVRDQHPSLWGDRLSPRGEKALEFVSTCLLPRTQVDGLCPRSLLLFSVLFGAVAETRCVHVGRFPG